jgi:hypothetical protein
VPIAPDSLPDDPAALNIGDCAVGRIDRLDQPEPVRS